MPFAATCKIDTVNLVRAHNILHRFSKTIPSEALHKTVGFIVEDAKDRTPVTPMSRIDTELGVTTTPVLVTRGVRAGLPRRDKKNDIDVGLDGPGMKIMLARLHPYSNYNILTDRKYAIDRASFSPGMGQAGFVQRLALRLQRMVKSRHSSTGFFKISWNPLLAAIAEYVPAGYRAHFRSVAGKSGRAVPAELGTFTPAAQNSLVAICKIENNLGMNSEFPTIAAIRNMRAHQILEPVLQAAINANYNKMMDIAFRKGLIDETAKLKALGFNFS